MKYRKKMKDLNYSIKGTEKILASLKELGRPEDNEISGVIFDTLYGSANVLLNAAINSKEHYKQRRRKNRNKIYKGV